MATYRKLSELTGNTLARNDMIEFDLGHRIYQFGIERTLLAGHVINLTDLLIMLGIQREDIEEFIQGYYGYPPSAEVHSRSDDYDALTRLACGIFVILESTCTKVEAKIISKYSFLDLAKFVRIKQRVKSLDTRKIKLQEEFSRISKELKEIIVEERKFGSE